MTLMPIHTHGSEADTAGQRCHNCRVRRLVCDQTLPSCRKCAARGVECPGYGRNLRWVQPSDKSETSKPLVKRARGRPRLQLMAKGEDTGSEPSDLSTRSSSEDVDKVYFDRRWIEKLVAGKVLRVEKPLLPADYAKSKFLLDHLHYHNTHMIKDIGVFETTANPHNIPLQVWRHIPSYLVNVLIATGTTHQIIRAQSTDMIMSSRVAMPVVQNRNGDIYKRLQSLGHPDTHHVFEHFQKAIGNINQIIADHPDLSFKKIKGLDSGDLMLAAVSGLLLSEVQQSAFGSWAAHLEALRVMIKRRGGFENLAKDSTPRVMYLLVCYFLVDVLRRPAMTSRTLSEIDDDQHQYLPTIDIMYQDGLETGSPMPTRCLEYMIKANQLRRRWYREGNDPVCIEALRTDTSEALKEARAFDPIAWAKSRKPEYETMVLRRAETIGNNALLEKVMKNGPTMDDWIDFAAVYQLATVIYGMRTTVLDRQAADWPSQYWIVEQGLDPLESAQSICEATLRSLMTVLRRLREKARRGRDWPWRFVFWPLFVAGMETSCSGVAVEERPWIMDSLYAIGQRQADFSLLDAADFFRVTWERESNPGAGGRTWDELVSIIDGQALFFV